MIKTILVTGAVGFIGSHACRALLARGDHVIGLDNLNDYYDPARKRANLAHVESVAAPSTFVFVEGDIRDRTLLQGLFRRHKFQAVVHLAAMAGVRASVGNPPLYYDVNLMGSLALLDESRLHEVRAFVLASTSSVYGRTTQIPFVESDPCDRPLSPYAASKRAAEMLAFSYYHLYGLPCNVLRFFTVYGPGCRPDMMAYKVLDNIFHGQEVPIYGHGQMHRDWTYIDDIVAGILGAVDRIDGYEIINLGRGEPVLLADFVSLIERLTGRQATLTPAPMPDTDMPCTVANIARARLLLHYTPQVSVNDGVERLWKWYERDILKRG